MLDRSDYSNILPNSVLNTAAWKYKISDKIVPQKKKYSEEEFVSKNVILRCCCIYLLVSFVIAWASDVTS